MCHHDPPCQSHRKSDSRCCHRTERSAARHAQALGPSLGRVRGWLSLHLVLGTYRQGHPLPAPEPRRTGSPLGASLGSSRQTPWGCRPRQGLCGQQDGLFGHVPRTSQGSPCALRPPGRCRTEHFSSTSSHQAQPCRVTQTFNKRDSSYFSIFSLKQSLFVNS